MLLFTPQRSKHPTKTEMPRGLTASLAGELALGLFVVLTLSWLNIRMRCPTCELDRPDLARLWQRQAGRCSSSPLAHLPGPTMSASKDC